MYVAHLSLTDFRSYAQVELPLEPGITALVGPNGQGKTNLVEALGYVATLGSHRVPTDAALVPVPYTAPLGQALMEACALMRIEKQIDSSSSTTNNLLRPGPSFPLTAFLARPRKNSRKRPDTVFSVNMELVGGSSSLLINCRLTHSRSCDVFVSP